MSKKDERKRIKQMGPQHSDERANCAMLTVHLRSFLNALVAQTFDLLILSASENLVIWLFVSDNTPAHVYSFLIVSSNVVLGSPTCSCSFGNST